MPTQAFAESFRNLFDFNQLLATQRRNLEALTTANQAFVEGAQASTRRSTEIMRDNVECLLKGSREAVSGGTPEASLSKQAEVTKQLFENTVISLREASELLTKASFEAFDVLNRRCAESIEEASQTAANVTGNRKRASK